MAAFGLYLCTLADFTFWLDSVEPT